jgi:hypothetical protein
VNLVYLWRREGGSCAARHRRADDAVHPTSFDRRLALQLQTKFDKERDSSFEVVDNDADVIHPLKRRTPQGRKPVTP